MRYTSPACILSFLLTAVARGELADAWVWNDGAEEEARSPRPSAASTPLEMSRANSSATVSPTANGATLTSAGKRAQNGDAQDS